MWGKGAIVPLETNKHKLSSTVDSTYLPSEVIGSTSATPFSQAIIFLLGQLSLF